MRRYELMLIIRPDIEITEKKAEEMVRKLLEKVGGSLASVNVWGKRQLAYPIQKATEGTYLLATVEADNLKSADMEKEVRMGSEILRFLLTAK
ncbi:30S ribosomal protein S6 [Candidatus Gottesmanbacteria bacterium]|nr:30S ribosomal protein S6 [Candidatus Gottesmanbacteria bacterium]